MLAVIFEGVPRDGERDAYFRTAEALRPLLAAIDGFVSIERFESLTQPGKILSLSFWRDEEAASTGCGSARRLRMTRARTTAISRRLHCQP